MSDHKHPLLATIDLGSNSFCLLIAQYDPKAVDSDKFSIIKKIKRKVRLASGLNSDGFLDDASIQRGLDCLRWFVQTLTELKPAYCRIVGTATLRIAKNAHQFVQQGEAILGHKIQVLSGEEEARFIYQGASCKSDITNNQLVIDIGGASTEIIIGKAQKPTKLSSLNMGCVTWYEQFFKDKKLNSTNFEDAIGATQKTLAPIKATYLAKGWESCFGASGTVQTIFEILHTQKREPSITLALLIELKEQIIDCTSMEKLIIEGLAPERTVVFPSGIAILLAIFMEFKIKSMQRAKGALREGLLLSLSQAADGKE